MRCGSASAAAERVVVLRKLRRSCGLMRGLLSRGMRSVPVDSSRAIASPPPQRASRGRRERLGSHRCIAGYSPQVGPNAAAAVGRVLVPCPRDEWDGLSLGDEGIRRGAADPRSGHCGAIPSRDPARVRGRESASGQSFLGVRVRRRGADRHRCGRAGGAAERETGRRGDEDRVTCPFCAEHIKPEAILCPHCGSIAATPTGRLARREGPIKSDAKALLDSLFFRIEEERSIGPSSRDAAKKILEWLDGMDPERRHRDVITKELRWSVTGTDRIADMDYSVHEALLDL